MRSIIKTLFRGFFLVLILPIWILYLIQRSFTGISTAFYDFSQLMSLFPGTIGNYLRYAFYTYTLAKLGKDACICFGATLSHPKIEIGRSVYIGPFCNLGLCSLGDHVLLGTGVHVMSGFGQHGMEDLEKPMREQLGTLQCVVIGEDCWIGNQSVIGANVGRKSVIGAASLVNKEIQEYSIAVGNPARLLRSRKEPGSTSMSGPSTLV